MDKKYELLKDQTIEIDGHTLYRIRALRSFSAAGAGMLGGFVKSEANLSHYDACWIGGDARVWGNAQVCGDALVCGNAQVWGNALIRQVTDYLTLGPIGSRNDITTFYRARDYHIEVACGCFSGSLDEFVERVKQVHGDSHHGKAYLLAADLARVQLMR